MHHTVAAELVLRRLYPWLGRAVHTRWTRKRSLYQEEAAALIAELSGIKGRTPSRLALRVEGYLGRLYREWFPRTWRDQPTYAEVVADFRWWLDIADRWSEPRRATTGNGKRRRARRKPAEPQAEQPAKLLRILSLPPKCTQKRFMEAWRRFLKDNHPDLNPGQSSAERRRFAEAVALWRR